MAIADLMAIPGMDMTEELLRMRKRSKRRMTRAVQAQLLGVALMNSKASERRSCAGR